MIGGINNLGFGPTNRMGLSLLDIIRLLDVYVDECVDAREDSSEAVSFAEFISVRGRSLGLGSYLGRAGTMNVMSGNHFYPMGTSSSCELAMVDSGHSDTIRHPVALESIRELFGTSQFENRLRSVEIECNSILMKVEEIKQSAEARDREQIEEIEQRLNEVEVMLETLKANV